MCGEYADSVSRQRSEIVLAVASLLLGMAQLDRSYTDAKVDQTAQQTKNDSATATAAQSVVTARITKLERELSRLQAQTAALRAQVQARATPGG